MLIVKEAIPSQSWRMEVVGKRGPESSFHPKIASKYSGVKQSLYCGLWQLGSQTTEMLVIIIVKPLGLHTVYCTHSTSIYWADISKTWCCFPYLDSPHWADHADSTKLINCFFPPETVKCAMRLYTGRGSGRLDTCTVWVCLSIWRFLMPILLFN